MITLHWSILVVGLLAAVAIGGVIGLWGLALCVDAHRRDVEWNNARKDEK